MKSVSVGFSKRRRLKKGLVKTWEGGSTGRDTCIQAWRPEFNPWFPQGGQKELSSDLPPCTVAHMWLHTERHRERDTENMIGFEAEIPRAR